MLSETWDSPSLWEGGFRLPFVPGAASQALLECDAQDVPLWLFLKEDGSKQGHCDRCVFWFSARVSGL